jgi:hypothetical protein
MTITLELEQILTRLLTIVVNNDLNRTHRLLFLSPLYTMFCESKDIHHEYSV